MASNNKKVVRRVKASTDNSGAKADTGNTIATKKITTTKTAKPETTKVDSVKKTTKKSSARPEIKPSTEPVFFLKPVVALGRYIANSWRELRQVEWPNRRATWVLTLGVIVFCIILSIIILISDSASQWLIKEVIL